MEILKFKLPLKFSIKVNNGFGDGYGDIYLNDLNPNEFTGIENLFGQYNWLVEDYSEYTNSEMVKEYRESDKEYMGFTDEDISADIFYKDGFYIIEILSKKPLDTIVTCYDGEKKMTLKEAIIWVIKGQVSDGVGENPLGFITYKNERHEVWLEDPIEIGDEY